MSLLLKLPQMVILGTQCAGGAGGNMICVNNVVAACSVVGLNDREGEIIKKTFMPFILYGIVVGIVAYIMLAVGMRSIIPY
ncbi:MAG: L-lactate permease, partial [Fusobacteriaceae bacterium]|jgi:lactate permease|nr:L-lactate permease [Fusobacteriaceae bacterium]